MRCAAGKIHMSEATKSALYSGCDDDEFDVKLRGDVDVKVNNNQPVLGN